MRRAPLLVFLAFIMSSLLMYAFGDSGLTSYARLSRYHGKLASNVASLEDNKRSLQAELESLRTDPDRIVVLAREIGLYRPDDLVFRFDGTPQRIEPYSVGALLRLPEPGRPCGPWLKATGIAVAVLPIGLAAFIRRRDFRRRRRGRRVAIPLEAVRGYGRFGR